SPFDIFFSTHRRPPSSTLFPYTTLFRSEVHQALTTSLLAAWMDKNLQYPVAKHLPIGLPRRSYTQPRAYGGISGGKVWDAAKQRSEEHTSELQSPYDLVCRLLLEKKKKT